MICIKAEKEITTNTMMAKKCKILDTYESFLAYWMQTCFKSVDEQIRLWQTCYMSKYPELLRKQVQNYEEIADWQEIAKRIFPMLQHRFNLLKKARDNILDAYKPVCAKAIDNLKLDFNITFIIYVGIGCGAGWATTYSGQPAVLLGLENIAEEKWHIKNRLAGLISHEIGHLAHMKWRNEWEKFEKAEEDPLFRLYSEGFARRCEHKILERETWHMAKGKEWLEWCERHKKWLAREFSKRLEKKASVNDFFGSWFNIQGKKQTGYFLGHAFIQELEKTYSIREIALFDAGKVRHLGMQYLKSISSEIKAGARKRGCRVGEY
jgi:hypothetical protein